MRKCKSIIKYILFIIIICISSTSIADDKEEEIVSYEINEVYKAVVAENEKTPIINSRHAVVYDRTSGEVLYGKKENVRSKMASTTKIMTALVTIENTDNLKEKVKISSKAAGTGGSRLGLHTNDEITVEHLLYGLLLCSRKR